MPSNRRRAHRMAHRDRKGKAASIAVGSLEKDARLQASLYPIGTSLPIATSAAQTPVATSGGQAQAASSAPVTLSTSSFHSTKASGIVTKSPHLYQFYKAEIAGTECGERERRAFL